MYRNDKRTVITLDAGGTNFVFSAMRGCKFIVDPVTYPSGSHDLDLCLSTMVKGFEEVISKLDERPVAISFAFPGPADYRAGIIGGWLPNFPSFRNGVALGPFLESKFGIPVFINNDGDLYAYGEAISGYLPWVNAQLERAGSPKRYRNLVGLTLGTGFGGGIVRNGELFLGDNSAAAEVWLLSQRYSEKCNIEESISIRAVRRVYGELTDTPADRLPNPKDIYEIGIGQQPGDKAAALEAFRRMGRALGDALCNVLTVVDGIAVIGGGVAGAKSLFVPAMMEEIRGQFTGATGTEFPRLAQRAFYLEDEAQMAGFLQGEVKQIQVPHTNERVTYDSMPRVGIGFSRIGTSKAISIGAYAFALHALDRK